MTREQVYAEMTEMFGIAPSFFKECQDDSIGLQWQLMKQVQFVDGAVPNKYRELIGIGIAAVTKCRYCLYFHSLAAKLNGATDDEIKDTLRYAMSSAGWSTWLNGLHLDFGQFCKEMDQVAAHIRAHAAATG